MKSNNPKSTSSKRARSSLPRLDRNNGYALVCHCDNPSVTCPILAHRRGLTPNSIYRQEFTFPSSTDPHTQYRPIDNLKTGTVFFDGTIYQQDYKNMTPEETKMNFVQNRKMNAAFTEENLNAHIKDVLYLPGENDIYGKPPRSDSFYEKPAKFIHPKEKFEPSIYPIERETEYSRMFKNAKREEYNNPPINYDNLHVYHDLKFNGNTEYRDKMVLRKNNPSPVRTLYQMNKEANQYTHTLNPGNYIKPESEYDRNFTPAWSTPEKKVEKKSQPPPLPPQFKHLAGLLYFDEDEGIWKIRKSSPSK
jgi:hypothetical protein